MSSGLDTLASETASPASRRWLTVTSGLYLGLLVLALSVAQTPLRELPQVATVYASGLAVTESCTAFLLFNL
ncbi:MAG: hypothetical protein JSS43_13285 [Proteobacteria bacterium]|nr:hypothetical protein [Pseudomonadota bacterium]